jgi:hypothetical protein
MVALDRLFACFHQTGCWHSTVSQVCRTLFPGGHRVRTREPDRQYLGSDFRVLTAVQHSTTSMSDLVNFYLQQPLTRRRAMTRREQRQKGQGRLPSPPQQPRILPTQSKDTASKSRGTARYKQEGSWVGRYRLPFLYDRIQ